jgi:glycosyltransferase involved in cell wall biosynthesis
MPATLSVVIAAKNCADRIQGTVLPWKPIATEIIIADQMSVDATPQIAEKLGCKVIRNDPPGSNFDLNRKLAMQQAIGDWILYIDTDERPTPELLVEVAAFLKNPPAGVDGVRVPNIFYFLGRPLRYGIYNPRSAEIRMIRRLSAWMYPCEQGFHRGISVQGNVHRFVSAYKHFNVNSLSEWFLKTNQYTEHDAMVIASNQKLENPSTYGAFLAALRFFIKHYFIKLGFLDGFVGLVSVVYFMLYHLTLKIKIWEHVSRRSMVEEQDYLHPIEPLKR